MRRQAPEIATCEYVGTSLECIGQVGARHVLLVARGAAEAAVAAGMLCACVARDLIAVHSQRLQPCLQLLVGLAVLLYACHTKQDNMKIRALNESFVRTNVSRYLRFISQAGGAHPFHVFAAECCDRHVTQMGRFC